MINIKPAALNDATWINEQYKSIDFMLSDISNEYILISESDGKKCGLGRITKVDNRSVEMGGIYVLPEFRKKGIARKIVQELLDNNPYPEKYVWCIPFGHLSEFYQSFGFSRYNADPDQIPENIRKKINWCSGKYDANVDLLYMQK